MVHVGRLKQGCCWFLTLLVFKSITTAYAERSDSPGTENSVPAMEKPVPVFDIWEFQLEGNTLLSANKIERVLYPYMGPGRTVNDVEEAANALERLYKGEGFPVIFIEIPEQDVVAGIVRLRAVEGEIERVRVSGSRYFTLSGIRESIPSLTENQPLHVPSMQRDLNKLNARSADLQVTPVLRAGKTPGAVEIDLRVRDKPPLQASMDVNNHGSANTSSLRTGISLSYDNLWQQAHSFGLQYQTSPREREEVDVWVATYLMPVPDSGNRLAFYAVKSDSQTAAVGDIDVVGSGEIYGARLVVPLPSTRRFIHSLTTGVDYKKFNEIIRLDPETSDKTPIDYAVWSFQYATIHPAETSMTKWGVGLNFGIRGFSNEQDEFAFKRFNAKANFSYLKLNYERTDQLFGDWQLRSYGKAQLADSSLINNEQFSVGGVGSVRGYYQSQQLADNGLNLGLELSTPSLWSHSDLVSSTRLLSFIEWAEVRIKDPQPGQTDSFSLAGAGLGIRMQGEHAELSLDWGWALDDNGIVEAGESRSHLGLQLSF